MFRFKGTEGLGSISSLSLGAPDWVGVKTRVPSGFANYRVPYEGLNYIGLPKETMILTVTHLVFRNSEKATLNL